MSMKRWLKILSTKNTTGFQRSAVFWEEMRDSFKSINNILKNDKVGVIQMSSNWTRNCDIYTRFLAPVPTVILLAADQ